MRDDLKKILEGPNSQENNFYVLCALTDFKNLLKECQKPKQHNTTGGGGKIWLAPFFIHLINFLTAFSKQFPGYNFPQVQHETKEKIKKYLKRTDYFLSYAKDVLKMW